MSTHGPDERLSAFYDGELSAAERAEVERLLTERADLRGELGKLSDLSLRLNDLADDLPEFDLRPRVLQRMAHARPAPVVMSAPPATRWNWKPAILLGCSLTLLVAALLPLMPSTPDNRVVVNGPALDAVDHVTASVKPELDGIGLSNAGAPLESEVALPAAAMVADSAGAGPQAGGVDGAGAGTPAQDAVGTGTSEVLTQLLTEIEKNRGLKPGDVISRMVELGEVPMLAEYTVVDVQRSSLNLEILLRQHRIQPLTLTSQASVKKIGADNLTNDSQIPGLRIYLVDAESASLNTALVESQKLHEVVALNVEPLQLSLRESQELLANRDGMADRKFADGLPQPGNPAGPIVRRSGMPDERQNEKKETPGKPGVAETRLPQATMAAKGQVPTTDKAASGEAEVSRGAGNLVAAGAMAKSNSPGAGEKSKPGDDSPLVNGNSLAIEHSDALYAELQQRQSLRTRNTPQNFGQKPDGPARVAPFSQAYTQRPGEAIQSLQGNGIQNSLNNNSAYSNSAYGGRNRQRAFLVLRPQSPPPPPEPSRIEP